MVALPPRHAIRPNQPFARSQPRTMLRALAANLHIVAAIIAAIYLLAAVCAVREVMASRTSQGSIAWLLSLFFLPFPTAFIYLVFGWKHFDSYTKTRHKIRHNRILRSEDLKVIDRETGKDWPVLIRAAGMPFTEGNRTELLIDGHATFDSIFAGIATAKNYVLVQFYIIRDDALGQRLADVLIERARAGVAVYVLYDDVGSSALPRAYRERLRAGGIKIFGFNQRHGFLRLFGPMRINYRNHRKNVVVDGKVGLDRRLQCRHRVSRARIPEVGALARHPDPARRPRRAGLRAGLPRRLAAGQPARTWSLPVPESSTSPATPRPC